MEISGRIKLIGPVQTFGTNGFQKRELVIVTEEQYPQPIMIEFTQNNVGLLDSFQEGQLVTVSFNLRGREWVNPQGETKYFNSVQGWRIMLAQPAGQTPPPPATPNFAPTQPQNQGTPAQTQVGGGKNDDFSSFEDNDDDDDLPF